MAASHSVVWQLHILLSHLLRNPDHFQLALRNATIYGYFRSLCVFPFLLGKLEMERLDCITGVCLSLGEASK